MGAREDIMGMAGMLGRLLKGLFMSHPPAAEVARLG